MDVDLDRLFTVGADAPLAAQDVFTNRVDEVTAFERSLQNHDVVAAAGLLGTARSARRNVLCFYGIGGVGKTRLSHELHARFTGMAEGTGRWHVAHRVDFEDGSAADTEAVLLGLRASLGQHKPVWPAFDLALGAYWERAHPGTPLQEALNQSGIVRRAAGKLDLGAQVQDAVEDLLETPAGVLGIFRTGAKVVGGGILERLRERRLLKECSFFEPVVEQADPAKMRPYLAALLAWDLAQLQKDPEKGPRLVVFLDTWERVQEDEPRPGGPEVLLSRLAYLMPNVLFVVTGRNQLRWADDQQDGLALPFLGPSVWPGLADDAVHEPRQHLVGGLSPEDAERYLCSRLLDGDAPAIPPDVREAIVRGAEGLPLYLDLSAARYEQILMDGRAPTADEFGLPLRDVVLRVMRDLPADQRALLRVASLVHAFDGDLLRSGVPRTSDAGAPHVTAASLQRFLARKGLVRPSLDVPGAHTLHECLREAVRDSDKAADAWSAEEWAQASGQLLAALEVRAAPELARHGALEQSTAFGLLVDGWRLAVGLGTLPVWLVRLASRLQSRGVREALAAVAPVTPADSPLRSAAVGVSAIGSRAFMTREALIEVLEHALTDPGMPSAAADYLRYWLGWPYEESGRVEDAEAVRLELALGDGPFAVNCRHALGRSDWVNGRLQRALSWTFDDEDPHERYWHRGLQGNVARVLGRFEESSQHLEESLVAAREAKSHEAEAHALRTLGATRCWSAPGEDVRALDRAVELYAEFANRVSAGEAMTWAAVQRTGLVPRSEVEERLARAREHMGSGGYAEVAQCFLACVHGDAVEAAAARERSLAPETTTAYRFWDAVTGWWLEELTREPQPRTDVPVEWLHGVEDARERWTRVLRRRRALQEARSS